MAVPTTASRWRRFNFTRWGTIALASRSPQMSTVRLATTAMDRSPAVVLMTLHFVLDLRRIIQSVIFFILWGHIKSNVNAVYPHSKDLDEFKSRITYPINLIAVDVLQRVYEKFVYHLDVCRASKEGSH